ncbi:hypothetical protein GGQ74_000832 [Desulfobaculum xiamenense]|uniref:Uncharacterized protein n=1 Tax=Desulfobaculum xiamenense TaxID=995050 RepID=A0A846QL58_9BACT|nr:hypothetical protein [Desulfobaculum xiamenense]NJB67192.1 hypothetical protein [Desulfobaculum xiamenense]
MRTGVKIFGTFNGISPEAYEELRPELTFDEVEYANGTVTIAHDGYHPGAELLVIRVMECMREGAESGLDILDHDENTIIRYAIEHDGFRTRVINMDDATPVYPEHRHE